MNTGKTLDDIKIEAGSDILKEIGLLEHEVQENSTSIDIYNRLSKIYTLERNYKRSTEIITLAINILNSNFNLTATG